MKITIEIRRTEPSTRRAPCYRCYGPTRERSELVPAGFSNGRKRSKPVVVHHCLYCWSRADRVESSEDRYGPPVSSLNPLRS